MSIITNGMEYSEGNPELIMARRDDHTLTLSYQSPRLYTQLMSFYRHNDHPAMQHVRRTEDGRVAKTINEKGVETMRQDSIRAYRSYGGRTIRQYLP